MPDELPANLYRPEDKLPESPQSPSFLEQHGTVVLLYSLVLLAGAGTFYLGLRHPENAKVFEWAAGFCGGAFSALTLAMRVTGSK